MFRVYHFSFRALCFLFAKPDAYLAAMSELPFPGDETVRHLREHLKALIIKSCGIENVTAAQLTDDESLFGMAPLNLTSLDAIEIAVAIEYEFGIDMQNASSLREYFKSISAMADFIIRSADAGKLRAVLQPAA